jgi:hypothetical protein
VIGAADCSSDEAGQSHFAANISYLAGAAVSPAAPKKQ